MATKMEHPLFSYVEGRRYKYYLCLLSPKNKPWDVCGYQLSSFKKQLNHFKEEHGLEFQPKDYCINCATVFLNPCETLDHYLHEHILQINPKDPCAECQLKIKQIQKCEGESLCDLQKESDE